MKPVTAADLSLKAEDFFPGGALHHITFAINDATVRAVEKLVRETEVEAERHSITCDWFLSKPCSCGATAKPR